MKVLNGLDLSNQKVINVADPSAATDAANKQYVDNVARGLSWKQPVRAASTGNINLASPGATIDGVSMVAGDRFLAKDQTTGSQKGIYVWNGASSAATRALDADNGTELSPGTAVTVTEGTVNGDKVFILTTDAAITIGTTDQTWGQLGGGTSYTASNGVQLVGADFRAVAAAGGGISVGAGGISVDASLVVRKASGNIGNGSSTSIAFVHNLGTKDVTVAIREVATDQHVIADVVSTDLNTVTITFATAPAANAYRVTVHA